MYKCRTCGNPVVESVLVCPHCGDTDTIYNSNLNQLNDKYLKLEKKRKLWIDLICFSVWLIIGFNTKSNGWVKK
jgi:uncharacterized membrane protein YvbJ